jgi:hypothetical protein
MLPRRRGNRLQPCAVPWKRLNGVDLSLAADPYRHHVCEDATIGADVNANLAWLEHLSDQQPRDVVVEAHF